MGRTIAAVACVIAAVLVARGGLAAPAAHIFHPGDVLQYDLAIELQVHVSPAPHSSQPPISADTSALGTETIRVQRADPDGSVHASVDIAVRGAGGGQDLHRTIQVKIKPDGSMTPEGGADAAVTQYISAIGDAARQYSNRTLHVGDTFAQTVSMPGVIPVKVTTQSRVVAQKTYRGYPTFAIESTGNGNIDTELAGTRAMGVVTVAGTTYIDQRDQLFIGEAMRSNVNAVVAGAQGDRVNMVATINLVLDSFTHGAVRPPPAAAPTAAPSPTPAASPSPRPPDEYYTPTPPAPTPSPVVNPYPPLRR